MDTFDGIDKDYYVNVGELMGCVLPRPARRVTHLMTGWNEVIPIVCVVVPLW